MKICMVQYLWSVAGTFVLLVLPLAAELPKDPAEYDVWRSRMLEAISVNTRAADEKAMEKLSRYVFQLSLPMNREEGDRPVYEAARTALMSLQGHDAYFAGALGRAIEAEFAAVRDATTAIQVRPNRDELFQTLGELPTPKVIKLLGQLLEDDRDPWKGQPASDYNLPHPNSYLAAKTLNRIGIEGVPVVEPIRDDRDFEAARDQWRLWFAQVKAGNRTFRFKGDPREYNLDGPVASVPVVNVETRGGQEAGPSHAAAATAGGRKPVWLPLALAILVLGVAFACWARGRRTA